MHNIMRFLSLLLTVALCVSLMPISALADNDTEAFVENNISLDGANSVGNLITNTLDGAADDSYGSDAGILDVTIDGMVATVEMSTITNASLVVAIYTEDGSKMLGSGVAAVTPEDEIVDVEIIVDSMPSYYVVGVYLLDEESREPLCDEFISRMYTQEFQEFLLSTVDDYDEERVLNLDDDNTTNFLVFSEETILIDANESQINDNGDGTYTITNAEARFLNLHPGDSFAYTYSDGTVLIVVVDDVRINGTTVTVTARQDTSLEDVFDIVKIDGDSDNSAVSVDDSTLDPCMETISDGPALDGAWEYDSSYSFSQSASISKRSSDPLNAFSISGSIQYSFKASVNIYISWSWQYVKFEVKNSLKTSISFSGHYGSRFNLWQFDFCIVPGVYAHLYPQLVLDFKLTLTLEAAVEFVKGFQYDSSSGFSSLNSAPKVKTSIDVDGKLTIGIGFEAAVTVVSDEVLKFSVEGTAAFELTAKLALTEAESQSAKHLCDKCIDGQVNFGITLEVKFKLLNGLVDTKTKLLDISWKITDFYYSFDRGEFGWGLCPYKSFLIVATVLDPDGNPVPDARIQGTGLSEEPITDTNGQARFYLPKGSYRLTVIKDGMVAVSRINIVLEIPRSITMRLANNPVPDDPGDTEDHGDATDSGSCGDDLTWVLYEDGTLVIAGTGDMESDWRIGSSPWAKYSKDISTCFIQNGVTSIGNYAFYWCGALTSITIPRSVTDIGYYAFKNCTALTSIMIPYGVITIGGYAFDGCTNLASVTISGSVTSIGMRAFFDCASLTSVTIGSSVESIEFLAFSYCTGLTSITLPNSLTSIDKQVFYGCTGLTSLTIPDSVTSIGDRAFADCTNLKTVTIPNSVTDVNYRAFENCSGITDLKIDMEETKGFGDLERLANIAFGNHVKRIGGFSRCTSLTSIEIPENVTSIEAWAFEGCTGLKSIEIPENVTSIGDYAFRDCTGLTSVEIPHNVMELGQDVFYECSNLTDLTIDTETISSVSFGGLDNLVHLTLGSHVKSIESGMYGNGAFDHCSSLKTITFAEGLESIGVYAFYACHSLENIIFPDSLINIGERAFAFCTNLSSVTFGEGLKNIEMYAFDGCTTLWSVYIPESVTSIGIGAFLYNPGLTDVYYAGSESEWKAISIGHSNGYLTSATIHYNSTGSALDGAEEAAFDAVEETPVGEVPVPIEEEQPIEDVIPSAVETEESEAEELPEDTEPPEDTELTEDLIAESLAVYSGALSESDGAKIAVFSDLVPGAAYVLIVSVSGAEDFLAPENLMFIAQGIAESDGTLAFSYIPRISTDNTTATAYGKSIDERSDDILFAVIILQSVVGIVSNPNDFTPADAAVILSKQ